MKLSTRIAVASFVALCTIQMLLWPEFAKLATVQWWQLEWMAQVGRVVSFPVLMFYFFIDVSESLVWLVAALWVYFIFLLIGPLVRILFQDDKD